MPDGRSGTRKLTCSRPMKPGARALKDTSAGKPFTVAVTLFRGIEGGVAGAAAPVATGLSRFPEPVR